MTTDPVAGLLKNMAMGGLTPEKEAWLDSLPVCPDAEYGLLIGVDRGFDGELRTSARCSGCEEVWFMPSPLPPLSEEKRAAVGAFKVEQFRAVLKARAAARVQAARLEERLDQVELDTLREFWGIE